MQKEYLGDGLDEARGPRPTNFDFNINRCKAEKLQEQMTVEKAICVLKVNEWVGVLYGGGCRVAKRKMPSAQ